MFTIRKYGKSIFYKNNLNISFRTAYFILVSQLHEGDIKVKANNMEKTFNKVFKKLCVMMLNQVIKIMHFKKISLTIKEIPQPT